jgi:hypothetical protein
LGDRLGFKTQKERRAHKLAGWLRLTLSKSFSICLWGFKGGKRATLQKSG